MHFSNISKVYKVSYSKNTLFLLQNYVTPRPQQIAPQQYNTNPEPNPNPNRG